MLRAQYQNRYSEVTYRVQWDLVQVSTLIIPPTSPPKSKRDDSRFVSSLYQAYINEIILQEIRFNWELQTDYRFLANNTKPSRCFLIPGEWNQQNHFSVTWSLAQLGWLLEWRNGFYSRILLRMICGLSQYYCNHSNQGNSALYVQTKLTALTLVISMWFFIVIIHF